MKELFGNMLRVPHLKPSKIDTKCISCLLLNTTLVLKASQFLLYNLQFCGGCIFVEVRPLYLPQNKFRPSLKPLPTPKKTLEADALLRVPTSRVFFGSLIDI